MRQIKYKDEISRIHASEKQKTQTWNKIQNRIENNPPFFTVKRRLATAIISLAGVVCVSGTVFADDIKVVFDGIFQKNPIVQEYVSENVFEASDGHIRIEMVELLSDEMEVQASVKYTALDEEGQQWLASFDPDVTFGEAGDALFIEPDYRENTILYGVNCGIGCTEATEYRSADERIFLLEIVGVHWSPALDQCIFNYDMTDGTYSTAIETPSNVPVYEYILSSADSASVSEYYTPTILRVSKLSYSVYGKNQGLYKESPWVDGSKMVTFDLDDELYMTEAIDQMVLNYESDQSIVVSSDAGFSDMGEAIKEENKDVLIASGSFIHIRDRYYDADDMDQTLDPSKITNVVIKDVTYEAIAK